VVKAPLHSPDAERDPAGLTRAVAALRAGRIVAYPTDTLYALAVDPRQSGAVATLTRIKAREAGAGLTLVGGDRAQIETALGPLPPAGRRLAARWWPGPVTLVFTPARRLVAAVHAGDGSLAVRVPHLSLARRLARAFGHPVTATSANRAGQTPAATPAEIATAFGAEVAVMLEHPDPLTGAPSTIVDVRTDPPVLLRAGVVPWDRVLQSARA